MTRFGRTTGGLLSASFLVFACTGGDGATGAAGTPGTVGNNGKDGRSPADGANGTKGADGKDGANGADGGPGPGTGSLSFAEVSFPVTNLEKHQIRASAKANVDGKDVAIGYQPIIRSGQDPSKADKKCDLVNSPTTCAGALIAKNGQIMKDDAGQPLPASNYNDFSSLLEVGGNKFLVHQFEAYPSGLNVTTLAQDAAGVLTAKATKVVDLGSVDGLYRSCAGSTTPWGTHITAEEAQVNARSVEAATTWDALSKSSRFSETKMMARYLGLDLTGTDAEVPTFQSTYSAYFHGYAVETTLAANGTPTVKKHYAMGRL
jgi:hypothetical protein